MVCVSWTLKHPHPPRDSSGSSKVEGPQSLQPVAVSSSGFLSIGMCWACVGRSVYYMYFPLSSPSSFALLRLKVWHILHVQKSSLSGSILDSRSMEYQKTWSRSRTIAQESRNLIFFMHNEFRVNSRRVLQAY